MGVKANFDTKGIHAYLEGKVKAIEAEIVRRMQYLGEQCINHARALNTYKDQTGNLRSSIGYLIVVNGSIVNTGGFKGSNEGAVNGNNFAREIALTSPNGFVLIVVAGMNYAKYVETRGFDVLTSAELIAKTELPKIIKQLKATIKKAA